MSVRKSWLYTPPMVGGVAAVPIVRLPSPDRSHASYSLRLGSSTTTHGSSLISAASSSPSNTSRSAHAASASISARAISKLLGSSAERYTTLRFSSVC